MLGSREGGGRGGGGGGVRLSAGIMWDKCEWVMH